MKDFSPLSEFLGSAEAQGQLEKFFLTYEGKLFIEAMREYALGLMGAQAGTLQDGARAMVEMMLNLTLVRQTALKQNKDGSLKGAQRPAVLPKQLLRKAPPPPSTRYPQPKPPEAP